MVNNIVKQAEQRAQHLPESTNQQVLIDFRGQNPTPAQMIKIRDDIVRKSNGIISSENIDIKF